MPWDVTLRNGFAQQQQQQPPHLDLAGHMLEDMGPSESGAPSAMQSALPLHGAAAAPAAGNAEHEAFYHEPSDPPVPRSRFAPEAGS